jgi:CheY-like chemotaxis protein
VLVSDLGMPEQDGYELIKKVRGDGIRRPHGQDSRPRANGVC